MQNERQLVTLDDALEKAEAKLFSRMPNAGELGWRPYTPKERKMLRLMAYTIQSEE